MSEEPRTSSRSGPNRRDLLKAGMGELPVANQDAQASRIKKRLVNVGNAIKCAGDADRIVLSAPRLA